MTSEVEHYMEKCRTLSARLVEVEQALGELTHDAEVIEKVAQFICSQGPWERVSPYNQQRAREMAELVTPIVGGVLLAVLDKGEQG